MRLAVFASGGGSNFQAIIDAIRTESVSGFDVALCVSSRLDAGVVDRAQRAGIPVHILPPTFSADGLETLKTALNEHGIDAIALAGFMKMIPAELIQAFPHRILNIHPSLLPAFGGKGMYGIHVHEAVIQSGNEVSGATVHFVDEQYDTGPILLQATVPVLENDTATTLADRVLKTEHSLYPKAIELLAEGRVHLDGTNVIVSKSNTP